MPSGTVNLGLVDGQEFSAANLDSLEAYISRGGDYGAGAPTGTGSNGQHYYDTTNSRLWISNGSAWVFVAAFDSAKRPGVILTDAAQSIGTAAATDITWGTEVSDVDGWTSGGSATLTVPTGWDGRYHITYTGIWSSTALGTQAGACLIHNGGNSASSVDSGGPYGISTISVVKTLAAADTLKVGVFQNSGGSLNVTSRLEIAWLGR